MENRDDALLSRMARGDELAAMCCYQRYHGAVVALAHRVQVPASEIEDAVQEVFIKLWRNAGSYDARRSPEDAFVRVVATRCLVDARRRHVRRQLAEPITPVPDVAVEAAPDRLVEREELSRVWSAIERLGKHASRVLDLRWREGWSYSAIARHVGWPEATVKTRARRAMLGLKVHLVG